MLHSGRLRLYLKILGQAGKACQGNLSQGKGSVQNDLHAQTRLEELRLILQTLFAFLQKQANLTKSSNCALT